MITAFIHLIRDLLPVKKDQPLAFPIQTYGNAYSVMQWNCLCSRYSTEKSFPKKNNDILNWKYRAEKIKQQILNYHSDIICLNEIDQDQYFKSFLQPEYEIFWQPKEPQGHVKEGVMVAIKKSKFNVIKQQSIHYQNEKGEVLNQFFHFIILQHIDTKQELWLVATHLKSKEEFEFQRVSSVQFLIKFLKEQLQQADSNKIPIMICGDLNTEPNSQSMKLIKDLNWFDSAFADQEFTTFKVRQSTYKRVIDYQYYSKNYIQLIAKANIPKTQEVNENGFPSDAIPSDHLFLYAIYQFK